MRGQNEFDAMYPLASFVVAHRWLQREIETSASRLAHVTLDAERMIASLLLPVSKTDVGGTGT
eukprot:8020713-Heterocapsa_arctica.AAC.1